MKAKFLLKINILLGIMAAFFAGCHSQKQIPHEDNRVMAKYGVPNIEQRGDTSHVEQQQPAEQEFESTSPERPDQQPRKYGPVPPSRS